LQEYQDSEQQLNTLISNFHEANNYDAMKTVLEQVIELANTGCRGAQFVLGAMYVDKGALANDLFKPTKEDAIQWLTKAADQGDPIAPKILEVLSE